MNLLLVDDEEYVIKSIKKNVNWTQLRIEHIYCATSIEQAKAIMGCIPIHVIVSDIVMPQGSGFDFMTWVREEKYDVQVIFLTSYAEFNYAKKAIDLNSVDYLLKPIEFDKLTYSIEKAMQRAEKVQNFELYKAESRTWNQNKELLQRKFLREIIDGTLEREHIPDEIQKRKLEYRMEEDFLLVYLHLYNNRHQERRKNWNDNLLEFIIGNVLGELSEEQGFRVATVFSEKKDYYVVIYQMIGNENRNSNEMIKNEIFHTFTKWFNEKLGVKSWCGVGMPVKIGGLRESLDHIKKMRENSLSVRNRVLYLIDFAQPLISYQNPYLKLWETLLKEQKVQKIISSIELYLNEMEKKEIVTRDILKKFRMDMTQLVYTWLAEQEIKAHSLFSSQENELYYQNAIESVEGAKAFADHLVVKAVEFSKYVNRTGSVTDQLKNHIDLHYMEEIRRDDLAELVYLNMNYMSRIFKREAGVSISTYLLQKRVEEGKKLLTQSDLPINTVSIYVGYSNFSYFTKMFRENTGYSPLEYRRKFRT